MATWIVITVEDLNAYLVAAQVAALRTAALGAGQADPFSVVLPDVAARIRAEIQGCRTNEVSATPNSIPPELKSYACHLILEAMQTRIPGLHLTVEQKTQANEARKYLARIARCEVPVAQPADPLEPGGVQRGGIIQVATKTTRRATRSSLSGL